MKLSILAILFVIVPLTVSASSLEIGGFNGKIAVAAGIDLTQENLSLNIKWYCMQSDWRPMSPTGWVGCGSEYSGEQTIKIDSEGNFSFSAVDVDGPWFRGVFVVQIRIDQMGKELQEIGSYGAEGYLVGAPPVSQLSLIHI